MLRLNFKDKMAASIHRLSSGWVRSRFRARERVWGRTDHCGEAMTVVELSELVLRRWVWVWVRVKIRVRLGLGKELRLGIVFRLWLVIGLARVGLWVVLR